MAHVLVITPQTFSPKTFWGALGALQSRGHTYVVASTSRILESEMSNEPIKIQTLVTGDLSLEEYDGLMFVTGDRDQLKLYWSTYELKALAVEADTHFKPIGAIGSAVPILWPIMEGKLVACPAWPDASRFLKRKNVKVDANSEVMVQAHVVTASHQEYTETWMKIFCDMLEKEDGDGDVVPSK